MSIQHKGGVESMLIGMITSVGIGTFFLHAVSAFMLAIIGLLAGWVFTNFIKPKLDSVKAKYDLKKNGPKAQ